MTKQFMIHKHPHVVTATEIRVKGSVGIVNTVLRFGSIEDLLDHFSRRGVPADVLETVRNNVDSTGMATITSL